MARFKKRTKVATDLQRLAPRAGGAIRSHRRRSRRRKAVGYGAAAATLVGMSALAAMNPELVPFELRGAAAAARANPIASTIGRTVSYRGARIARRLSRMRYAKPSLRFRNLVRRPAFHRRLVGRRVRYFARNPQGG